MYICFSVISPLNHVSCEDKVPDEQRCPDDHRSFLGRRQLHLNYPQPKKKTPKSVQKQAQTTSTNCLQQNRKTRERRRMYPSRSCPHTLPLIYSRQEARIKKLMYCIPKIFVMYACVKSQEQKKQRFDSEFPQTSLFPRSPRFHYCRAVIISGMNSSGPP